MAGAAFSLLLPGMLHTGLPAYCAIPSELSVSSYLIAHMIALALFLSVMRFLLSQVCASPFPRRLAGRPGRIEFVVYGLLFRLQLLSTPPCDDAVTFDYRPDEQA